MNDITREEINELQAAQARLEERVERNRDNGVENKKTLKALHQRFDGFEKAQVDYEHRLSQAPTKKDMQEIFDNTMNKGVATIFWKGLVALSALIVGGVYTYVSEWWKG